MTPSEYIATLLQRKEALQKETKQAMIGITLDLIGMVRLRVQSSGINPDGVPFADYVPTYKKSRAAAGYQVEFPDITRTGRTLNSIAPEVIEESDERVVVEAAPRTSRGVQILTGLSGKRPRINYPSDDEIQIARDAYSQYLFKILTQ